jgi:hypothetical protein
MQMQNILVQRQRQPQEAVGSSPPPSHSLCFCYGDAFSGKVTTYIRVGTDCTGSVWAFFFFFLDCAALPMSYPVMSRGEPRRSAQFVGHRCN